MRYIRGEEMSIKINEPYPGSSIYSQYMIELKKMTDDELVAEYERLCSITGDDEITIRKSILVDFIVRFHKEYLME
jgi:hypothetical protein